MFVKQMSRVRTSRSRFAAASPESSRAVTVTSSVAAGALVAAALATAPMLVSPAYGAGLTISDGGACGSWSWNSQTSTLTCLPATQTANTPACTITANPSSIAATTQVALTATCSNTDGNTTYAWTGTGVQAATGGNGTGSSPQTQNVSVSATTTFGVRATNSAGSGNSPSVTVALSTGGSGAGGGAGGGAAGPISCPGYNTTVMNLSYVPSSGQLFRSSVGLSRGSMLVVTFTTPATIASGYGAGGLVGVAQNVYGASNGFSAAFSTTPCTTTYQSWPGTSVKSGLPGQSVSWTFNSYRIAPNTTYYVNITGDTSVDLSLTAK